MITDWSKVQLGFDWNQCRSRSDLRDWTGCPEFHLSKEVVSATVPKKGVSESPPRRQATSWRDKGKALVHVSSR